LVSAAPGVAAASPLLHRTLTTAWPSLFAGSGQEEEEEEEDEEEGEEEGRQGASPDLAGDGGDGDGCFGVDSREGSPGPGEKQAAAKKKSSGSKGKKVLFSGGEN